MTSEQLANAAIIVSVGNAVGASAKQTLAAIEAALVESSLRNLRYGDRDSQGLFQQRPSQGWGSVAQVTNPHYAAQAFFLGAGSNPGALTVSQSGTAGNLAQRVQRSAYPSRYDQRETEARQVLAAVGGQNVERQEQSGGDNEAAQTVNYYADPPAVNYYTDPPAPAATEDSVTPLLLIGLAGLVFYLVIE